ncbi:MAG: ATPase domain-containing protein [Planctomycetota bacterium]
MSHAAARAPSEVIRRVSSGISELDYILNGGFPRQHCILIAGATGTGKTTLALQFLLAHQARGERSLFVSMAQTRTSLNDIARSHGWELDPNLCHVLDIEDFLPAADREDAHLFKPDLADLVQTCSIIVDRIREIDAKAVVLDTLSEMRLLAVDPLRFRRAIYNLKTGVGHLGIPLMLITDHLARADPIPNLVDTVVELEHHSVAFGRDLRRIRIQKMRSSDFIEGYHDLRIQRSGMHIFPRVLPRTEGYLPDQEAVSEKFATGSPQLDQLLGGGLDRGARILSFGPTGVGKSTLGYQLALTAAARGEGSVIWSFEDLPHLIRARMAEMTNQTALLGRISLHHMEQRMVPPGEFVRTLIDEIKDGDLRLVILDSLSGLTQALGSPPHDTSYIQDLMTFLTAHGVMVYITMPHSGPSTNQSQEHILSLMADTILSLQYTVDKDRIGRCLGVIKQRSGPHHTTVHNYSLDDDGLHIGRPLSNIAGLMPGQPRHVVDDAAS